MTRIRLSATWLIAIGVVGIAGVVFLSGGFTSARGSYHGDLTLEFAGDPDRDGVLRYALLHHREAEALHSNSPELESRWKAAPPPGTALTVPVMGAFSTDVTLFGRRTTRYPYRDVVALECRDRKGETYLAIKAIPWNAAKTEALLVVAAEPRP
jgi:hypothetical protein